MKKDYSREIKRLAEEDIESNEALAYKLKNLLRRIESENFKPADPKTISTLYDERQCFFESDSDSGIIYPTGFDDFDKIAGGFIAGEYIVVGSRPAMGKTQFLINLALNFSQKHPVLYCSFELSSLLLTTRFISTLTGLGLRKLIADDLDVQEKEMIKKHEVDLKSRKILIGDYFGGSISAFTDYCTKQIKEHNIGFIFIDYIQLMNMSKSRYGRDREFEISRISRELKNIAKENGVCVIIASQLNRSVETRSGDKRPVLSDLRESGAIEQDADKVLFIHRPEYYGITQDYEGNSLVGLVELIVAKNRSGATTSVWLSRDSEFTTIRNGLHTIQDFEFNQDRINEIEGDTDSPF